MRTMRVFGAAVLLVIGVALNARGDDSKIVSSFDVDLEGWITFGGQQTHKQGDRDHAGYLQITDNDESNMTVLAPEQFIGNQTMTLGSTPMSSRSG